MMETAKDKNHSQDRVSRSKFFKIGLPAFFPINALKGCPQNRSWYQYLISFIHFILAMQMASKSLMDTLTEVYEPQWPGQDLLTVQGQNSEMLWADLAHKLSDQVLIPLNTYQGQFPEMRKKIEKRGRKLIDYDKERHNVQTLQANPNRNEAKYAR